MIALPLPLSPGNGNLLTHEIVMADKPLTDDQLLRYSRQIMLPQVDVLGQERLSSATVMIVGAGGLGAPAALYLAGAGIGKLILVDNDKVEVSNLHRQVAYRETDIGHYKAQALAMQLKALNSQVDSIPVVQRADKPLLEQYLPQVDVLLDCSDNFATRALINECCLKYKVPLVSGAAIRMEGQLAVFDFRHGNGPCYHCLYGGGEETDTLCSETGVMGPVVGIIGTAQALEAIKLLTGLPTTSSLQIFDAINYQWRSFAIKKDVDCAICG
jgi:adenylyltransferase/sulfurtransferase